MREKRVKNLKIENINVSACTWCEMHIGLMDPTLILAAEERTMGTPT
jgi:hypothetical protein